MRLTSRQARGSYPKNLLVCSFIIKGKVGRERRQRPPSSSFLSSYQAPPPGWAGEFSCPHTIKPRQHDTMEKIFQVSVQWGSLLRNVIFPQIIVFYVGREYVLGVINLLSLLSRMWVSGHRCFIVCVGGDVSSFCCMNFIAKQPCLVLWVSKPAFLSDH